MAVLVETARDAAHADGAGDGGAVLTLPELRPAGKKSRDAAHAAQALHRSLAAAIARHGVLPHRTGDTAGVGQLAVQRAEAHTAVHDAAAACLSHNAAHMDGGARAGVGDMHRCLTAVDHAGAAARDAAGGVIEDAVAAAVRLVANDAARQADVADHTAVRHGAEQAGIAALCGGGIGDGQAMNDEAAAIKGAAVAAGGVHAGGSADGRPRHIAKIQRLHDTGAQGGAAFVDPVSKPRQLRAGGDEKRFVVRSRTAGAASRSAIPAFIRRNAIAADGVFHTGGGLLHGRAALRRTALYFVYIPGGLQRRQRLTALTLQPSGDFPRRLPRRAVQLIPESGAFRHRRQARLHTGNGGGKGVLHLSGGSLPGSRQMLLVRQRLLPAEQRPSLLRRQQEGAAVGQAVCTGVERRQQRLTAVGAVLCEQAGIRQVKGVVAAYGRGDPEAAAARQGAAILHRAAESARYIGGHPPLRPPCGQRGAAISRRGGRPAALHRSIAAHTADESAGAHPRFPAADNVRRLIARLHRHGSVGLLPPHKAAGIDGGGRVDIPAAHASDDRQAPAALGGHKTAHRRVRGGYIQRALIFAGGDGHIPVGGADEGGGIADAAFRTGGYGAVQQQLGKGRAVHLRKERQSGGILLRCQRQRHRVATAVEAAGKDGGKRCRHRYILRQAVAAVGIHGGKFCRRGDGLRPLLFGGGGPYSRRQQAQRQRDGQQQGDDPLSHGFFSCSRAARHLTGRYRSDMRHRSAPRRFDPPDRRR